MGYRGFVLVMMVVAGMLLCSCESSNIVYICTGPSSSVWHCKKSCPGLDRCSGKVVSVKTDELSSKYKKACGICY